MGKRFMVSPLNRGMEACVPADCYPSPCLTPWGGFLAHVVQTWRTQHGFREREAHPGRKETLAQGG